MSISSVDIASVALFVLGFAAGILVIVIVRSGWGRNPSRDHEAEIARYEATLADFRQEHAENIDEIHLLRRRMADTSQGNVEAVRQERDWALEEVDKLNRQLQDSEAVLVERERSLREARMAIHEIRLHIERERSTPIGEGAGPGIGGPARSLGGPATATEAPNFQSETTRPMGQGPSDQGHPSGNGGPSDSNGPHGS